MKHLFKMEETKEQKVSTEKEILVAVYGTLRKGYGNHSRILGMSPTAKYLGTCKTPPKYTMYHLGGFPGVIEEGDQEIEIEVYSVTDDTTKLRLDRLEGYSGENNSHNLYNKSYVDTEWGKAEIYIYNHKPYSSEFVVKSGNWNERNS